MSTPRGFVVVHKVGKNNLYTARKMYCTCAQAILKEQALKQV